MYKWLRRVIKGTILVTAVTVSVGVLSSSSYAYDSSKKFNKTDISTWNQGSSTFPENDTMLLGTSQSTIHRAGCGYYSLASVLVKAGYLNPKTESPIDVVKKANSGSNTDSGGWHFDFNKVSIFSSNLSCTTYVSMEGMSEKEGLAFLKSKYMEGCFCVVCVVKPGVTNGHYIFVDGFDSSGDMIITDSGFAGTKWSDLYGQGGNTAFKYVHLIKDKTKKCNELPSVYSGQILASVGDGSGEASTSKSASMLLEIVKGYSDDCAKDFKNKIYWVYSNSGCKNTYQGARAKCETGETVSGKKVHRVKINCAQMADWALADLDIFTNNEKMWGKSDNTVHYSKGAKEAIEKWCDINFYGTSGKSAKQLEEEGKLVPGDICTWGSADFGGGHTNVYAGDGKWYDSGRGGPHELMGNFFPDINERDRLRSNCVIFTKLGPCNSVSMNTKPTCVIHVRDYVGLTNEEQAMVTKYVSEWELTGMPRKTDLSDLQCDVSLADKLSLTVEERTVLSEIDNNIKLKKINILNIVRSCIACVGILLMLYGIFLIVAMMFDLTNNFIDISLVRLLTLGKWVMVPRGVEAPAELKDKVISIKRLLIRVLLIELTGVFLISGMVYSVIYKIMQRLGSI